MVDDSGILGQRIHFLESAMSKFNLPIRTAAVLAMAIATSAALADEPAASQDGTTPGKTFLGLDVLSYQPLPNGEFWLDSGFASYHFDRDRNLNGDNYGLGAEYRFSNVDSITIGRFYNSDREYSNYAGVYYQPLALGPVRFGAVVGGFNGYPHMKNGGWFAAAVPMASAEFGRFGFNLAYVPTLQNRLYGAISLQVKIKLW
jgi:hypothetical protein